MKRITFYLDFISPYAYLAFEKLPETLQGLSYAVDYTPVLFAGMLKHHGQLGPAEITPKRDWTYRQVMWLAHTHGVPLDLPASHPFNPLALLRLAVATGHDGMASRYVCENLFWHVWRGGAEAGAVERLQILANQLQPLRDMADPEVKAQLVANTDRAIQAGVFGVPTFQVDEKLFWGLDSLPMLRAYLAGDDWFAAPHWDSVASIQVGIRRT